MRTSRWQTAVSPRVGVIVCCVVLAGGAVFGYFLHGPPTAPDPAPGTAATAALPPGSYPTGPLGEGTPSPALKAAGWINDPPPRPGASGARLIVLDIWADW